MSISGVNSGTNANSILKQTKTENAAFEIKKEQSPDSIKDFHEVIKTGSTELVQQSTSDPIPDYYHAFCEQYSDVSFRLGDREDALKNGRSMGYKDSMNSVGEKSEK